LPPTPLIDPIRRIVADMFEIPLAKVHAGTSSDNVSTWDSIRHLNMVLALEDEFGVQFTPEEIEELLSVELIEALLNEKLEARISA
jgi:acyl carrier protein